MKKHLPFINITVIDLAMLFTFEFTEVRNLHFTNCLKGSIRISSGFSSALGLPIFGSKKLPPAKTANN